MTGVQEGAGGPPSGTDEQGSGVQRAAWRVAYRLASHRAERKRELAAIRADREAFGSPGGYLDAAAALRQMDAVEFPQAHEVASELEAEAAEWEAEQTAERPMVVRDSAWVQRWRVQSETPERMRAFARELQGHNGEEAQALYDEATRWEREQRPDRARSARAVELVAAAIQAVPVGFDNARSSHIAARVLDELRKAQAWLALLSEPADTSSAEKPVRVTVGRRVVPGRIEQRRGPAVLVRVEFHGGSSAWEWFELRTGKPVGRSGNRMAQKLAVNREGWRIHDYNTSELEGGA